MLCGNERCLTILGEHYNVMWLLASLSQTQEYRFWVLDALDGPVTGDTRFTMLHCDGIHYSPMSCAYRPEKRSVKKGHIYLRWLERRGELASHRLRTYRGLVWGGASCHI